MVATSGRTTVGGGGFVGDDGNRWCPVVFIRDRKTGERDRVFDVSVVTASVVYGGGKLWW